MFWGIFPPKIIDVIVNSMVYRYLWQMYIIDHLYIDEDRVVKVVSEVVYDAIKCALGSTSTRTYNGIPQRE